MSTSNTILPFTPSSSKWRHPFRLSGRTSIGTHPTQLVILNLIARSTDEWGAKFSQPWILRLRCSGTWLHDVSDEPAASFTVSGKYVYENGTGAMSEPFTRIFFILSLLFYSPLFRLRFCFHPNISFKNSILPPHWFLFIESKASVSGPLSLCLYPNIFPWRWIHQVIQKRLYQPTKLHGVTSYVILEPHKLITNSC